MTDRIVDHGAMVVVERDTLGWHRSIDARGPSLDDVDAVAVAETASAARIWDRVLGEGGSVAGVRARATRAARVVADDRREVRHLATTTSVTARLHAADGTFVVVRRSIAYDVGAFARERDLDAEVAAFADDVAFVRTASASTRSGTVLLSAGAAGTVLHEAIGHLHEADNVARFGPVAEPELPVGLAIVDLGETPGSDHPRLDDRLQPMRAATLLDDDGRRAWLGVDERPHDAPPHVARARRAHRDAPYLARMTHLVVQPTTLPAADDRRCDVEVDDVVAAFVDLRAKRITLHLGASRVRRGAVALRAHGGRIDLDLTALRTGLRGFVGAAATEIAMCDKQGQRLPVATTCPALVIAGVTVRDVVV